MFNNDRSYDDHNTEDWRNDRNPLKYDTDYLRTKKEVLQNRKEKQPAYNNDDDDELDIKRFHYSQSSNFISNKGQMDASSIVIDDQKLMKDLFKREENKPKKCIETEEYCESSCKTYQGASLILDKSLAPMYNCSGRFFTNFDTKKRELPLQDCSVCSPKNTTCLNLCCHLVDTSVNDNIPRNITVSKVVNGTTTNTTTPNPNLNKVCYCPIDRYGPNCQYFYPVRCNLTLISPKSECYSSDGKKLTGLQYYNKANNCPLFNYTEVVTMQYHLLCYQELSKSFNVSLAANNYTFYNKYILNQLPLYISKTFIPISFTTRLWNFNHLGQENEVNVTLSNAQLVGNETIDIKLDLGKYYLPDNKMRSIYNGGRIAVESGFTYGHHLMNTDANIVVSYINIGNYFKNVDFFEKEVILKTIKQILSIVIPIVAGSLLLIALFFFVIYILYKKSRPTKIAC
ncbi:hypothetical protein H8356DRAFT_1644929 [Neocallimastix lanati (nom. inval.)]|uniref:Uncharacterized protein n=1 Tax=Neocallimastix californiae TaxID=1754190 RepID=A0A1Y2CQK0_9FUNG|nr:hypothetical protein H8356DRAFT_1644929 [Neocallimastix sp. JGI-2020a]ORY49253.1 hypothetical protein LY90DRAFT_670927 [Neocallimastix californiae]|eukprot:ORY49253.1 hypothetical protein LY90DRAFT_670927 [Neocallimastix californiae]